MTAVRQLVHDHEEINRLVLALGAQFAGGSELGASESLAASLAELRDTLFLHFAREEEGLFPFVAEVAADLQAQVDAMLHAHDAICGVLARMVPLAEDEASVQSLGILFERFAHSYAEHSKMEAALLADLDARLDPSQRDRLDRIIEGL